MKRKRQSIPKKISVDSSVILAYLFGEEIGQVVKSQGILPPKAGRTLYCSRVAISESFYILCRRESESYARESISSLLVSGYLSLVSSDELDMEAGRYKCSRTLSLADCYVLSVAKTENIPAIFAKMENDLKREIERHSFDVKLLFLEDQI